MEEGAALDFTVAELGQITSAITDVISVTDIVTLIASILGVGAVFVLMWFGIRKGKATVLNAIKNGRI